MAEEEERRLVMTGSVCLDKFIVDTDRLSASKKQNRQHSKRKLTVYYFRGTLMTKKERVKKKKESWSQYFLFERLFYSMSFG